MLRRRLRFKNYARITAIVTLMSFYPCLGFGTPLTAEEAHLTGSGTRLYSELEVDRLIDDLTDAAHEEIEKAAALAAKAATMASLEREAAALQEATRLRNELTTARGNARRNVVIGGLVCLAGGFALGAMARK